MSLLLGAVADDFTGATDLANTLVRNGMRTVQTLGVPKDDFETGDVDAIVIALKSRTMPPKQAIADSQAALSWLAEHGCQQIVFKYCSTFDSTDSGNIGPVAEALMAQLGTDFTIACPAFPANNRTIYMGNLFVGQSLLHESGMQHHPLTPMTDANLVRVLGAQCQHKVGLIDWNTVKQGADAIAAAIADLRKAGVRHAIVDAIADDDLLAIGAATRDLPLITGGSGVAVGLPQNFRDRGVLRPNTSADAMAPVSGASAAIAGSCSQATREQVATMKRTSPSFRIDPALLETPERVIEAALEFSTKHLNEGPILIFSSADPDEVADVQRRYGRADAGARIERVLAEIGAGLVTQGVRRLIVAGGETAGAVVARIGVTSLKIGPQIDPGVPWTMARAESGPCIALALKSGNFGAPDFFLKAFAELK